MKRKTLLLLILFMCVFAIPNVFAANITGCKTLLPNVVIDAKIPNAVHTIIVAIKIVAPILLVLFGMLDLLKGIYAQKEDEIKKARQIFVKRLLTAAIIFFVVSIVQLVISFVAGDEPGMTKCISCFINGTDENGVCK